MTLGTRLSGSTSAEPEPLADSPDPLEPPWAASSRPADENMLSRRPMMTSFGESGFPVVQAGHTDWQRPHSVHVTKSSICFQEKWSIWPTPKTVSSVTFSMSMSGVEYERSERPWAPGEGDVDRRHEDVQVLGVRDEHEEADDDGDVEQQERRLEHAVDPGAERVEGLADDVRGEGPPAKGKSPVLTCAPRYRRRVIMTPAIMASTSHAAPVCEP